MEKPGPPSDQGMLHLGGGGGQFPTRLPLERGSQAKFESRQRENLSKKSTRGMLTLRNGTGLASVCTSFN